MNINGSNTHILFVTNAESGQANTVLALALEVSTRPHVQVHIASFPVLKSRVERLNPTFNFHPLDGTEMAKVLATRGLSAKELPHLPTTKSYAAYDKAGLGLVGWDGECMFFLASSIWTGPDWGALLFSLHADIREYQSGHRTVEPGGSSHRRPLQRRVRCVLLLEPGLRGEQSKPSVGYRKGTPTMVERAVVLPIVRTSSLPPEV